MPQQTGESLDRVILPLGRRRVVAGPSGWLGRRKSHPPLQWLAAGAVRSPIPQASFAVVATLAGAQRSQSFDWPSF
jgi:hypothetical protein